MSVCCECCVLSGRCLRVGLIIRPVGSYRVWCVWVSSWSLDNEEALVHWGLLRHEKRIIAEVEIIFPQSLLHYEHTFSTFTRQAVCRSNKILSWSAAGLSAMSFSPLLTTDTVSNWANIYGILIIYSSQTPMNLYRTGAFSSKKFSHHSLLRMYVHTIRHFTLLLCCPHRTDWSTDDPGGAGQCRHPVDKVRNTKWRHI
jgi:hypothetical protein